MGSGAGAVVKMAVMLPFMALLVAVPLSAHPLHSSYAEIRRETNGTIAISVRLFADDFGATIESLRARAEGSPADSVAQEYFARSVMLSMPDGTSIPLVWCGMKSEAGLTWLCARSAHAVPPGQFRVRNALMFDRFADQVSIIRWIHASGARTLVLSARAPEGHLD